MILNSILSGIVLFNSFSMRTPKIQPNPDDYEVSVGIKHSNYYINRQWERELGKHYIDDEVWFEYSPTMLYIKPKYVNKTSRDLKYSKIDVRYKKDWFSVGYTGMYSDNKYETFGSFGIHRKKQISTHFSMETKFDGYFLQKDDSGNSRFDMEDYVQLNWLLTEKLSLYNLFDYHNIKNKKFYKFKIGIEYKL